MTDNTCICCGCIIPEGRQICLACGGYDDMQTFKSPPRVRRPEQYEPVRHGEWIDMGDFAQCSCCGSTRMTEFQSFYGKAQRTLFTKYCPNCGAKMGDKHDE